MTKLTKDIKWRETLKQLSSHDEENLEFDEEDENEYLEGSLTLRESLVTHKVLGRAFKDQKTDFCISFSDEGDVYIYRANKLFTIIDGDSMVVDEEWGEEEE